MNNGRYFENILYLTSEVTGLIYCRLSTLCTMAKKGKKKKGRNKPLQYDFETYLYCVLRIQHSVEDIERLSPAVGFWSNITSHHRKDLQDVT